MQKQNIDPELRRAIEIETIKTIFLFLQPACYSCDSDRIVGCQCFRKKFKNHIKKEFNLNSKDFE